MNYYFSKSVKLTFEDTITKVTEELQKEGFGIITEINVTETFKKKLNIDFRKYRILGACNPAFAHKAIIEEEKIGLMLPCNVIIIDKENEVEVSAINPMASMQAVENPKLIEIAKQVSAKLESVIGNI